MFDSQNNLVSLLAVSSWAAFSDETPTYHGACGLRHRCAVNLFVVTGPQIPIVQVCSANTNELTMQLYYCPKPVNIDSSQDTHNFESVQQHYY